MAIEIEVSVFQNGRSRAVRIPVGINLPGEKLIFRQEGEVVTLAPSNRRQSLAEWLATLEPLDIDWPEIADPPPEPLDL